MSPEELLREHLVNRQGRDPQWVETVFTARRDCQQHYDRVACVYLDGWAFLMPREQFLRVMKREQTLVRLQYCADVAITPEGKVWKHRWDISRRDVGPSG